MLNTISYDVNVHNSDVSGKTISQVRQIVGSGLNLPATADSAEARVNGATVGEDYVVKAGEAINFVKKAGEKGC